MKRKIIIPIARIVLTSSLAWSEHPLHWATSATVMKIWLIIAVIQSTVKLKPEKNSGLNRIRAHDICDTGALPTSYQANWELCTLLVHGSHGFESRSINQSSAKIAEPSSPLALFSKWRRLSNLIFYLKYWVTILDYPNPNEAFWKGCSAGREFS